MTDKFNVDGKAIRMLAELLDETGLSEIEYELEGRRIRVAKASSVTHSVTTHVSSPLSSSPLTGGDTPPLLQSTELVGTVKSPMIGIVYLSPKPGADSFIKVGAAVEKGDTLLIIEAMKVMNPIRAPHSGRITHIFIQDTAPVEFGSPLVVIE